MACFLRPSTVRFSILLAALCFTASLRADDRLSLGVAIEEITPPVGYRMSGYFSERFSTGILDPLLAKAIVLRQGDVRAALVFCDLIGVNRAVGDAARKRAHDETGIPIENISLAATHSHTGPLYSGVLRDYFHERALARSGEDPAEAVDYRDLLARRISSAIVAADKDAREVKLFHGVASESRLSFNRRFHMKDGKVVCNPGQQNPDIVRAAGPIDPDVGLIRFDRRGEEGSRPASPRVGDVGAIVGFALHLDTLGGTLYSADYPGALQEKLRERFGEGFVSLFGAGTCGDINHVDVSVNTRRPTREIGELLAETVAAGLEKCEPIKRPSLAVRRAMVEVPLQQATAERLAQAKADLPKVGTRELSALEQVEAVKIADLGQRGTDRHALEVQVVRLSSEAAIVFLPGEVFVELGLSIKEASPFRTTLVVELTNDSPAYIPTKKAFAEGSYETINSRIAPGGGEAMAARAIELLLELRR